MPLTPRELNRTTLARQLLIERERLTPADAIRRVVAVQAQEPASPYVALWNRLAGFHPEELDAAFTDHAVFKATLMRITLHAVHAEDYPTFRQAMLGTLRAARLNDRRFTSTGRSAADADALVPHLLQFASRPRTRTEIEEMLADRLGGPPEQGVWWALRTLAPLIHAPTGGAWSFGPHPSFLAAPAEPAPADPEQSLRRLIRRYLEGFGPASAEDFAQFALQKRSVVRAAMQAMTDELITLEGPEGAALFDIPDAPRTAGDTPAPPRLMAMWDSVLLAYFDRSRVIPAAYRPLVIRRNGDVLPTLLVDGYVSGVWRPFEDGIEALAFHPLPEDVWSELAAEAASLLAMLAGRQPAIYGRHTHWWSTLPSAEIRLLPG